MTARGSYPSLFVCECVCVITISQTVSVIYLRNLAGVLVVCLTPCDSILVQVGQYVTSGTYKTRLPAYFSEARQCHIQLCKPFWAYASVPSWNSQIYMKIKIKIITSHYGWLVSLCRPNGECDAGRWASPRMKLSFKFEMKQSRYSKCNNHILCFSPVARHRYLINICYIFT